jgi:hypothetical protein
MSYPLTEPPLDVLPKRPFLPFGLAIAAVVLASFCLLLWYGCGWMVTSDAVWRHVGANMRSSSSSNLAAYDAGQVEDASR